MLVKPEVTVIMPVFNDKNYIENAVNSILNQSYKEFEFIIINDKSTDGTEVILKSFSDNRIKIIHNERNLGISRSRNIGIQSAIGEYIFITDSDCEPEVDWIKNGLLKLKQTNALAVEGLTYYVSRNYKPELDDKLPGTLMSKGHYMTANMAYKKEVLLRLNGFDENHYYLADRDLALRILKQGNIAHCEGMAVKHQMKKWTPLSYLKSAIRAHDRVRLIKYRNDRVFTFGFILFPKNILKIFFPPLVLFPIIKGNCKNWNQLLMVLTTYPRVIYERIVIWRTAIKNKVLII